MSPVYRVLLYFKPTYCIRPYFGLAYCVPFNNNNTFYLRFHFHEEGTKIQFVEWTGRLILAKSVVLCFLDSCSVFDPYNSYLVFKMNSGNKSVRAKRERENNLALFDMSWLMCILEKIAPFLSKIWCLCSIEHGWFLRTAYRLFLSRRIKLQRKNETNTQMIVLWKAWNYLFILLSRWCNVHFSFLRMSRRMTPDFGHYGTMVIHLVQLFYEGNPPVSCAARTSLLQACVLHTALFWQQH